MLVEWMWLDCNYIEQILLNFVGNVIKFIKGGCVEIEVEVSGEFLDFCVIDMGIGILEVDFDCIFEDFESVGFVIGGMGLGLGIVMCLVKFLKGEIGVESMSGEGSVFWFCVLFQIVEVLVEIELVQ